VYYIIACKRLFCKRCYCNVATCSAIGTMCHNSVPAFRIYHDLEQSQSCIHLAGRFQSRALYSYL
jgi:hypothetical protein